MASYQEMYKQLKKQGMDLDRVVDGLGMPIDQGIKPLVAALNLRGYKTTASCEGHPISDFINRLNSSECDHTILNSNRNFVLYTSALDDGRVIEQAHFNSPWVDIHIDEQQGRKLADTITGHNEKSFIKWFLRKFSSEDNNWRRLQVKSDYHPLELMQKDSSRLAEKIYDET